MDPFSKKDYKELLEEIHQQETHREFWEEIDKLQIPYDTEEDRIKRGEHQDSNLIQVLQRIARALEAIEKSLPLGPVQKQRHY